mmetsp:Transcript_14180/g.26816  ORF Transcript_14180/g.26816 Transcript_14180/m.26816 type:complete len:109 (-) Transcript_14180:433-759(-)
MKGIGSSSSKARSSVHLDSHAEAYKASMNEKVQAYEMLTFLDNSCCCRKDCSGKGANRMDEEVLTSVQRDTPMRQLLSVLTVPHPLGSHCPAHLTIAVTIEPIWRRLP